MSTSSIRSISTSQQATTQSSPSHLNMKETPGSLNHSYYPSAHRMVANSNSETIASSLKKPRIELYIAHDQWMETPVVMNTGQQQQSQQPPLAQQQQQQQQQQKLPSVRCTVCKDSDGTPVLYRPSMALHTLFQAPDQDDPSPTTTRYSKRMTAPHDGIALHKVDSNQKNSNRLSYLSVYDITDGGGGGGGNDGNDNSSRIGNDGKNDGNMDDDNNNDNKNDDANGDNDDDNDDNDDDDDDGLYQRLVIPKQRQSYVTLYDATNDHPIWSLIEQDWHTMTLISRQLPQKYTMMTTSTFSFLWEEQAINGQQQQPSNSSFLFPYQWRMKLAPNGTAIELLCEQCQPDRTKLPVALLANQATQLTLFGNDDNLTPTTTNATGENSSNNNIIATPTTTTALDDDGSSKNPFRSLQDSNNNNNNNHHRQRKLDSLDTFLVLSSLVLYDLITSQLRALGGGTEAMAMMIDRQQQALKEEIDIFYKQYQQQQHTSALNDSTLNKIPHANTSHYYSGRGLMAGQREEDIDDIDSDVVMDHHHHHHHNDINNNGQQLRWSSNGSMKSLELDPGFWRCCFGYGCWWNWFPCCMPGGWCDRVWIKTRGIQRQQQHHHHHRSRVTRRMQGWQQQEE